MKDESVLCIEAKNLPPMNGKVIKDMSINDITGHLLTSSNLWFIPRYRAENDPNFLQIIPYILLNQDGHILTYQRPPKNTDERLSSKWSIGVGGHINLDDYVKESSLDMIIINAALREIREEFGIWGSDLKNESALIFDPSNDVGKVHLGVLLNYDIPKNQSLSPNPSEIANHVFYTKEELNFLVSTNGIDLENWSKFIITG